MMLYIEVCFMLLQAWPKLPHNLFLMRLPYMLRTCQIVTICCQNKSLGGPNSLAVTGSWPRRRKTCDPKTRVDQTRHPGKAVGPRE